MKVQDQGFIPFRWGSLSLPPPFCIAMSNGLLVWEAWEKKDWFT